MTKPTGPLARNLYKTFTYVGHSCLTMVIFSSISPRLWMACPAPQTPSSVPARLQLPQALQRALLSRIEGTPPLMCVIAREVLCAVGSSLPRDAAVSDAQAVISQICTISRDFAVETWWLSLLRYPALCLKSAKVWKVKKSSEASLARKVKSVSSVSDTVRWMQWWWMMWQYYVQFIEIQDLSFEFRLLHVKVQGVES